MKPNETTPRNRKFIRVLDGRKQPVRGLWKRGEIYYAQLVKDGHQMKRRLDAQTNAEAIAALNKLKVQRQEGKLKIIRHAPKLSEAIALYKASEVFKDKRHATRRNEETYFKAWEERLGKEITPAHIIKVRDDLRADKAVGGSKAQVTKRTANLYVMALKQVFKFLVERDSMADVPRVPRLKAEKAPERPLLNDKQVSAIFVACERPGVCGRNGALLADYLRFLALTGCREAEAYRIKWADINLAQRVLTIGADGRAKNGESRTMQMTDELEGFLKDMQTRRQVDCSYLFPSPRRGKADAPVKTLRDGFKEVRDEVGLPHLGFHDFRHLFISKCVMAGVLIGKVYGHLNDEHKVAMAQRLTIFKQPENVVPLPQEQAAG
jgi:integrase